jgi:hypothetical protein
MRPRTEGLVILESRCFGAYARGNNNSGKWHFLSPLLKR